MTVRWSVKVRSDYQGGWVEIGRANGERALFRVGSGTDDRGPGEAHVSLDDAKELHQALDRVIEELEEAIGAVP